MTVVSQKRDFVFDFDSHVITQRGEYIYLRIDGRDVEIGKYESHERAQEVLKDMIEKERYRGYLLYAGGVKDGHYQSNYINA